MFNSSWVLQIKITSSRIIKGTTINSKIIINSNHPSRSKSHLVISKMLSILTFKTQSMTITIADTLINLKQIIFSISRIISTIINLPTIEKDLVLDLNPNLNPKTTCGNKMTHKVPSNPRWSGRKQSINSKTGTLIAIIQMK